MNADVIVTVAVVAGLSGSCAWWADERHLALRASSPDDLPEVLEAAAATIRNSNNRS